MPGRIPNTIFLFDVDGTLTVPRKRIENDMQEFMRKLSQVATIGIVGGSDFSKQIEQLGENLLVEYHYVFSENGLMYYKEGTLIEKQSIKQALGEENLKRFINFCLHYIADLDIPIKRGTFIEFRNGMLNISPIGRNCSQEERDEFEKYDLEHKVRAKFVAALKSNFPDLDLVYSIGGQISFDVFPSGWDKTYCLKFLKNDNVDKIYFFGDKTMQGGNDFEIFTHPDTIGHTVKTYHDTMAKVSEILKNEYDISF